MAFIGVMFITPDSLLIRLSNIDTWGMLFYRGAIPFVVVLIGLFLFYKNNFLKALFKIGYPGIFYVISFSICNITFIISIQNTNVANTLLMVALAPMLSAILGAKIKLQAVSLPACLLPANPIICVWFIG